MIIVTGGAGFIGSAIIWRLNQLGKDDILVVDNLGTDEKWKNLVPLKFHDYMEKDEFLSLAINQRLAAKLRSDREPIEAIIHMGACSSTVERDATYLIQNNFEYTKQLAMVAVNEGSRFIYASSAATYGDGSKGFADDEKHIDRFMPLNMYGYSKQIFDKWALWHGLFDRIVGIKYFNVFGPNEYHKGDMRSVVAKAYEQIKTTGKMQLFKSYREDYRDGEQVRDFIYVKDAVDMTLFFLENKNVGGLFNVGSGVANTWNKLASAIFNGLGMPSKVEFVEMPETIRDKYQYRTTADISRIRRAGYTSPITGLDEAVSDYVRNYLVPGKRLAE